MFGKILRCLQLSSISDVFQGFYFASAIYTTISIRRYKLAVWAVCLIVIKIAIILFLKKADSKCKYEIYIKIKIAMINITY